MNSESWLELEVVTLERDCLLCGNSRDPRDWRGIGGRRLTGPFSGDLHTEFVVRGDVLPQKQTWYFEGV